MTATEQKKIRAIAGILPSQKYPTVETVEISGADLLLSGQTQVEGKEINPDKTYHMRSPVYNEANHYRRMKRAFEKHGADGISAYLKLFVSVDVGKHVKMLFPKREGVK